MPVLKHIPHSTGIVYMMIYLIWYDRNLAVLSNSRCFSLLYLLRRSFYSSKTFEYIIQQLSLLIGFATKFNYLPILKLLPIPLSSLIWKLHEFNLCESLLLVSFQLSVNHFIIVRTISKIMFDLFLALFLFLKLF